MGNGLRLPHCCIEAFKTFIKENNIAIDKGAFDEVLLFTVDYKVTPIITFKTKKGINAIFLIFEKFKTLKENGIRTQIDIELDLNFVKKNYIEEIINGVNGIKDKYRIYLSKRAQNLIYNDRQLKNTIEHLINILKNQDGNYLIANFPLFPLVQYGLKKWSGRILESKYPINLSYILVRDFEIGLDGKIKKNGVHDEYYFFSGFSANKHGKYEKIMPLLSTSYRGENFVQDDLIKSVIDSINEKIKEDLNYKEKKLLSYLINVLKYGNLKVSFELVPMLGFNSQQIPSLIPGSLEAVKNKILEIYFFKIKVEVYWLTKSTITGTIALHHFLHDEKSPHRFTYRGLKGIDNNGVNLVIKNIQEVINRTNYSSNQNYLLVAPHGSGKESYANLIILANRHRYRGEFMTISAVGNTDTLLSQLFGERVNAAVRSGLVEKVKNGALFIDEIGKSEPEFRSALLRFLQTGDYMRKNGIEKLRRGHLLLIFASTDEDLEPLPPPPDFWDRLIRIDIDNPFKNILDLIDSEKTSSFSKKKLFRAFVRKIKKELNSYEMFVKYLFLNIFWDYFENEIDPMNPITMEIFKDHVLNSQFIFESCEKFWENFRRGIENIYKNYREYDNKINKIIKNDLKNNHDAFDKQKVKLLKTEILKKRLKENFTFRYFVKFAKDYVGEIYKKNLIPQNIGYKKEMGFNFSKRAFGILGILTGILLLITSNRRN